MLKILFGSWLVVALLFALLFFGVGFYYPTLATNPGLAFGSVKGWYGFGAIMLFLWFFNAIIEKKNS